MAFSRPVHDAIKWCSFFTSVAVLALTHGTLANSEDAQPHANQASSSKEFCSNIKNSKSTADRMVLLVSTLDGRVTALDGQSGEKQWHVDVGDAELLSSSLSKLQINRNGVLTHLIPSLDGGLYQFDGEAIEPVPLAADILLSSSFRFNDDTMVVGGKETQSYGIDVKTGNVHYICTMDGCTYLKDPNAYDTSTAGPLVDDDDILVISRNTKTIRAVEMKTGLEKWNFSVGQHEVSYMNGPTQKDHRGITEVHDEAKVVEEPVIDGCSVNVEEEDYDEDHSYDFPWTKPKLVKKDDIQLKVIVPHGRVLAVNKRDNNDILWQHKFATSIAAAWVIADGTVEEVSLFDAQHNLALSVDDDSDANNESSGDDTQVPASPLLYVGVHANQLYVQPSVHMITEVEYVSAQHMQPNRITPHVEMPRVQWKPYIATAASRTPAATRPRNPLQIGWSNLGQTYATDSDASENSLAIWHEQYPYDGGFYLYPEPIQLPAEGGDDSSDNASSFDKELAAQIDTIKVSLINWWREVLAISILSSILMNLFLHRYVYKKPLPCLDKPDSRSGSSVTEEITGSSKAAEISSKPSFTSRYETDFEQLACLGKGGFGVVFKSRNKMDDCDYAVKRIALNNSDRAREKVMREVKALAKLEHLGIVRYYQAWFESPPIGWQEERDRSCLDLQMSSSLSPGHTSNSSFTSNTGQQLSPPLAVPNSFNPLQPFQNFLQPESGLSDIEEVCEDINKGSEGFIPSVRNIEDSGSVSLGVPHSGFSQDSCESDSFSICFKNSTSGNCSVGDKIPFGSYNKSLIHVEDSTKDSLDVVFEDSGCSEINPTSKHKNGDHRLNMVDDFNADSWDTSVSNSKNAHGDQNQHRPKTLNIVKDVDRNSTNQSDSRGPTSKLYLYIQMQLCRTDSLKDWLCNNTLNRDSNQCLDYFHQILSAVDYVHHCGLMHRDLKPSNIFFSMDGAIKVGDFGLVTAEEENFDYTPVDERSSARAHPKHTDQVGTELYMSPEQCAGKLYTQKVDIFAMGMIFFELFFPFSTQMERTKTLLDLKLLIFPKRFVKELPDHYKFVKPMLSHDPVKRPSSRELLQSDMLTDYEEARQAYHKMTAVSRLRTISNSSNGSQ